MLKYLAIGFWCVINHSVSIGQKNDYVWPMGNYGGIKLDQIDLDTLREWSPFILNFNKEPMTIDYFPYRRFNFETTNSTFGNNEGALICYSNGMEVFGQDDLPLVGGDTIMYGEYWRSSVYWRTGERLGFRLPQGSIMLPISTEGNTIIYIFTTFFDADISRSTGIWYATIDTECDDRRGCVTTKDNVLLDARVKDGILQACRHANGRDWWLNAVNGDGTTYYTFLLDPSGVNLIHTQQIGRVTADISAGNAAFSHEGDKYAVVDGGYWDSMGVVSIYNFDRCTGLLSNPFFDTLVIPRFSLGQGASFSPDGRYFYANNMNDLYQYDMKDLSQPRVHLATYDGFQSDTTWEGIFTTQFGFWATGPDGRLYNVSGAGSARHMHIMDYPNEQGEACSFRQHALKIPNNPFSIPNFPHYRLGPLDGSSCDTLGLDNHPIAKYRYEADSIKYHRLRFIDLSYFRPETWSWNYGDGSPRESTQSPYHTFPSDGTYHVCLTVSNENSSNTVCRTITIGTSSSDDIAAGRADVSTFPNPVQDYLLVTLGEYVPAHGEIMVYDMSGRIVKTQRIYYGQNNVDMRHLPAGVYVWRLMDGSVQIQEGKVVKE